VRHFPIIPTLSSVNLARRGATLRARGRDISTGIFKDAASGRVRLGSLGLDGDFQADKRYHGGPQQAVYAFSAEQAAALAPALGLSEPPPAGFFGENFTTRGLEDDRVAVGDVYGIGTAVVQVTKPRSPCYKLGLRAGSAAFLRPFLESRRIGFYLRVREEGEVGAGDEIRLLERPDRPLFLPDLVRLLYSALPDPAELERAIASGGLSESIRERLAESLAAARGAPF